jgi:hypothetical protein
VWDQIAAHGAPRTAAIHSLSDAVQAAAKDCAAAVEAALARFFSEAMGICHLDEGRVERLVEAEAAALNLSTLEDRCGWRREVAQLSGPAGLPAVGHSKCSSCWRVCAASHVRMCPPHTHGW